MSVTRLEMVDIVANAFRSSNPTRAELLGVAVQEGARPQIIELLQSLPDRRYQDVRDVWTELPQVPVGA